MDATELALHLEVLRDMHQNEMDEFRMTGLVARATADETVRRLNLIEEEASRQKAAALAAGIAALEAQAHG